MKHQPQHPFPSGHADLVRYRAHGGGADLFRAYLRRRQADGRAITERRRQLTAAMEGGLPLTEFDAVVSELTMQNILTDLDSVICDVLEFSEHPGPKDQQLSKLRATLRIGKKTAPAALASVLEAEKAVQGWIAVYLDMQKTGVYRSPREIAREVADMLNIGARSATRYWDNFKKREPHQAQWAAQIADMAKSPAKAVKARAAKSVKPKSTKPSRRQRLKFGR